MPRGSAMKILIDGYNLLHASGVFGKARGPRGFEASRQALLDTLGLLLGDDRHHATVVFDAADAPPGLPDRSRHDGIEVLFARHHPSADALIEELIEDHHAPGHLTVVSADNRVIAAARRRRAAAVPSGTWFAELRAARPARTEAGDPKPGPPADEGEVAHWLREFGFDPADER
jgi:predicted RNA-binding protein with PIN domain